MRGSFQTLIEDTPGEAWKTLFERFWPAYRAWFLRSSGPVGRPGFLDCRRALRKHMPELVPVWEKLVEVSGGGDLEARFLSMWCPPPYIAGCSQAIWLDPAGGEPALLRNYDFVPALLEGSWCATRWCGRRVVAIGDCLWGALDGMNEAGLAVSLSFGGSRDVGPGFGIPIVMRHLLESAGSTGEAIERLAHMPVNMCYSITLLDASDAWATVFVGPDRPAEVTRRRVATNFQHRVEWPQHARATLSAERFAILQAEMERSGSLEEAAALLLDEPLFQTGYGRGYGTLYSAIYRPRRGEVELFWRDQRWSQSVGAFSPGRRDIDYPAGG